MIELVQIFDKAELLKWRHEVIREVFATDPSDALMAENEDFYKRHIADGSHVAILAKEDGEDMGCGSLCLSEELPSPDNPSGKCGYLMNIYVRDRFRQHGVAHKIVSYLIEVARNKGCGKIYLETTPEGRPVYESLGFHDLPDMMKLGI